MITPISTSLKRVLKKGKSIFKRNGWLTIATVITMFLSILVFTGVLIMNYTSSRFVTNLKDKIDISIYFKPAIEESEILVVQEQLGKVEGVVKTEYISRDKALAAFKQKYGHNDVLLKALNEIGENPLSASLNIKIKDSKDYEKVLAYVETAVFKDKLVNINFTENRDLLSKTTSLINSLQIGSLIITAVLTLVAVIVAFNTIRIAIYSMREEINIMKLVGATNWFVRGPFVLAGCFYGLIAAGLSFICYVPLILTLGRKMDIFLGEISITKYFFSNIFVLLLAQIGFGIVIGIVSAVFAVSKYLDGKMEK